MAWPLVVDSPWTYSRCRSIIPTHDHEQLPHDPEFATHALRWTQWPSSSVSFPQVTLSAAHFQVQMDPTRTITSDLLSATFDSASPPPQQPVPTPFPHAATQTFPHTAASRTFLRNSHSGSSWLHLPRMTFSALRVFVKSLHHFLTRSCKRLGTASHLTMLPHNYRSRSFSSGVSSPLTLQTAKRCHRHVTMLAALPQQADIATLCSPSSASHASDGHEHTTAPHAFLQPPPGLEKCARQRVSRGIPVKVAPVRPRLCASISVTPPQPHVSTTHVNTFCALSCYLQEKCKYRPCGNPQSCRCRSSCRDWSFFLNLEPLSFLWSNLVIPNLMGKVILIQPTVISCIINIVFLSFSGIQARRAGTLLKSSRLLVESSMRLFFKKPVIMSRTSPISSLRTLATRTLLSFSTRTPLSLPYGARIQGRLVVYGPTRRSRPPATPFSFWNTDCYILLSTHSQCRGQKT